MYVSEEFEHAGFRVRIIQDDDAQRPDEWEETVLLAFFGDGMGLCPDEAPVNTKRELQEFVQGPDPEDYDDDEEGRRWLAGDQETGREMA